MSEIKYTELDFAAVKNNLKNFLKSQNQFKDYDFDGSSLSILLDVLAYNTAYNGFYLNMLASEMFLDSAHLRESVVSRAKHLGYTPRSVRTLSALVDITRSYPDQTVPTQVILKKTDTFYTIGIDGNRYSYTPRNTVYFNKINNTTFFAKDVELIQGKRFTHTWVVESTLDVKQRYCLPNENVDTTTIMVTVKSSTASTAVDNYTLFEDLSELSPKSKVYFLQEYENKKYEIVFGDDMLGVSPKPGNVVTVEYVVSGGDATEGAKAFRVSRWTPPDDPVGANPEINITAKMPAKNYALAESIESIKMLAPKNYTTQNRAVTKHDYETLLKKDIPTIEHIRVWGGEENEPPMYGKVFCSIKPVTGTTLSVDEKRRLLNGAIKNRSILSTEAIIVDPEYIRMTINTVVNYFPNKTTNSGAEILRNVVQKIKDYRTKSLVGFDSDFRYSKLLTIIDAVDTSIESNITSVAIKYRIFPPFDSIYTTTIKLNNSIDLGDAKNFKPSVTSSDFIYNGVLAKIADDGAGRLYVYKVSSSSLTILNQNVGSVDYINGIIKLNSIIIDNIPNNLTYIDIFALPSQNDIITLRNQILLIEDEDISVKLFDLSQIKLS